MLHQIDPIAVERYQHRMIAGTSPSDNDDSSSTLSRCTKCKRLLEFPDEQQQQQQQLDGIHSLSTRHPICIQYQQCPLCITFKAKAKEILAWRLSDAEQRHRTDNARLDEMTLARKEFLVKWMDMSYRHVAWVPEDWIKATNNALYEDYIKNNANDFPLRYNEQHPIPKQWMTIMRILDVQDENGNTVQAGASNDIHRVFAQVHGPTTDQGTLHAYGFVSGMN